jgi:hypothetical protein
LLTSLISFNTVKVQLSDHLLTKKAEQ